MRRLVTTTVATGLVVALCAWAIQAKEPAPDSESSSERDILADKLSPDPGEPPEAIKAYLDTERDVRKAIRRIEIGLAPNEPDFSPQALLDKALAIRRQTAVKYPTSRHAWDGLGTLLWARYKVSHRAADLRGAVEAYERAAELAVQQNTLNSLRSGTDFSSYALASALGRAALSDVAGLDKFFDKLKGTDGWPLAVDSYATGLGLLNDPRAASVWNEMLAAAPPHERFSSSYVEFLYDRQRYQEALAMYSLASQLGPTQHAQRGAMLERVGRTAEAKAEYQHYFDAVNSGPWGSALRVPDRYRIPGSTLQQGIKFRPDPTRVPKPSSALWRWLAPSVAWADHVAHGCPPSDWFCKAHQYITRTIHGEAGCLQWPSPTQCWGTRGGQRAVAWNIRTRVFYGLTAMVSPRATVPPQRCAQTTRSTNSCRTTQTTS